MKNQKIHESWIPYLAIFIKNDRIVSESSFLRHSKLSRSKFYAAQCNPITEQIINKFDQWVGESFLNLLSLSPDLKEAFEDIPEAKKAIDYFF
jgi:hypothetical protein